MSTPNRARGFRPGPVLCQAALCLALGFAFLAVGARGEDDEKPDKKPRPELGTRVGQGVGREQMWPAPTAENWQKPCLLTFQRTWDDAVAVSKETGKPILCCINMDGEIASEHYAGVRYRQPEIAAIYKPYVCVIASVYRHTPRDYDDQGRRVVCPRFGSVTCGEHIAIEPGIFEKFCDGRRIAPRHIMVDLDGKEAYDVYYVNDTAGVFDAIWDGVADWPEPKTIVRGDRPVLERVASRHVSDREAVEAAYRAGDEALRKALLEAAVEHKDAAQLDLLRLAVFGLDVDLSRVARKALAATDEPNATQLISESMQVPMDPAERDALIEALRRLGDSSALARWLAGVHGGLAAKSKVDVAAWTGADTGGATYSPTPDADTLTHEAEAQARAAEARPDDPTPRIEFAESSLKLAMEASRTYAARPRMARQVARAMYEDARRGALDAEALGASGWRVSSVIALAAYYLGDLDVAYERAALAMEDLPPGDTEWRSMALVTVFAESRWKGIKTAVKEKREWPAEWLADLHAAYAVLMRHPLGTDGQVVWHYEFLVWLGAEHRAERVLREGVERFQGSEALHERLRQRLIRLRGVEGLEAAYAKMVEQDEGSALLTWYAGVASDTGAHQLRRSRKWQPAMAAYGRAIVWYEQAAEVDAGYREIADHAVALALAGRARVAYLLRDDDQALLDVLASLAKSPRSAGARDPMGVTPGETAQMLLARLEDTDKTEMAAALAEALGKLDPELLTPDRGLLGDR